MDLLFPPSGEAAPPTAPTVPTTAGPGLPPLPPHLLDGPPPGPFIGQNVGLMPPRTAQQPPLPPHLAGSGWNEDDDENEPISDDDDSYNPNPAHWLPIAEDTTEACADELEYLADKVVEHSALDHKHWEQETFTDLGDPELVPGESGRIDWLVKGYNGTKEAPNMETLMRSPVVRIGGLDWQIKFHPKGHDSAFLSVYVECTSMLTPEFAETEDCQNPPFPFLEGTSTIRRRRSVAAQFSVVMYNPAEPRVNEFRVEAHQFHKKQADYGWQRYSQRRLGEFHHRQHLQRLAILRNDQLAFSAYIRVIDDPTGSLWEHGPRSPDQDISVSGLRPFKKSLQYMAGVLPLLHFAPFRKMVQELRPDTALAQWLQPVLLKMFTRQRSSLYNTRGTIREGDVMEMLWKVSAMFHTENDLASTTQWQELVGIFHSEQGSVCGANRLNTKDYASIQDAVDHHPKSIWCPQLLTMELTRQEHDKTARKWRKLTNKVRVDENLVVKGTRYTLFAFITHCGHLMSSQYNAYVRPNGMGKGWYCYSNAHVSRLTEKEATDRHSGPPDSEDDKSKASENTSQSGSDSAYSEDIEPQSEVCSVVMYVRDDVAIETFNVSAIQSWVPPSLRQTLSLTSQPKPEQMSDVAKLLDPFYPAMAAPPESFPDNTTMPEVSDEARLELLIRRAASVATPEPERMDGEDIIMQDVDEPPIFMEEVADTDPANEAARTDATSEPAKTDATNEAAKTAATNDPTLEKGTSSWLGRSYYEGQFKERKYHGGGYYIDTNGDEYLGGFENGLKHGFGKMVYASTGDVYNGHWEADRHHGTGTLTERSTGNVFEGSWVDGKKHGAFVLKGTVTEEDRGCCTICYDNELSTAFYDCGHVVACSECAAQIDKCPICRRDVKARLQLFGVRLSTG